MPFAKRGYRILAIELGERLAELAAHNCRDYLGVEVVNIAFEDWELEERAFDLALSVDALHWIPPEVAYPKIASALKDTGSAVLAWRVPVDPGTDWSRAIPGLGPILSEWSRRFPTGVTWTRSMWMRRWKGCAECVSDTLPWKAIREGQ